MPAKRAESISVKNLSKSVDRAVAIALKRHAVRAEGSNLLINWEIIGRILRNVEDVNVAFGVATEITKNVALRGIKAEPAFCRIDRDILVGFIERAGLPKAINR